jgi:hypothetical protein
MTDRAVCRFCGSLAAARFRLDRGCVCYPDDRIQDLCMQHVVRATPLGGMELMCVLDDSWMNEIAKRFGSRYDNR